MNTKLYHYKTERNADILSALKSGLSYADTGRKFSVSRERIRQIANEAGFQYDIDEKYITVSEAPTLLNLSTTGITNAIRGGRIKAVKIGYKWFIPRENYLARTCAECGQNPVPLGRNKYCSVECHDKGQYKVMKRYQWRRFYKKQGRAIPASLK